MMYRGIFLLLATSCLLIKNIDSDNSPLTEPQLLNILNSQHRFKTEHLRDVDRVRQKRLSSLRSQSMISFSTYTQEEAGIANFFQWPSDPVDEFSRKTTVFGGKELVNRTKGNRLANVTRLDQIDFTQMGVPKLSVDIAFMGINYHDLFFTNRVRNGQIEKIREKNVDYAQALSSIHKTLKDDGVLIIIDHFAKPGSGYQAANELHRIDPNIVMYQLNENGFELLEEAFYLRNPNDTLESLVFAPEIRGKTSRFIYKFGKR